MVKRANRAGEINEGHALCALYTKGVSELSISDSPTFEIFPPPHENDYQNEDVWLV